ncbi:hypothetical protein LM801050_50076 [Listeria monocytogenes]|nr:hypothetical protein LM601244_140415 [Listeria monocytogenes]CUK97025.1 hypothetical protein LM701014_70072 [Listeria monocytogenes]CUL19439.1 hypothetical protein LM701398_50071 [Listeria monocytogenes]CUL21396.1 hypothetical protein LM701481_140418 [Listeria monocytogenes]CUL35361.1 hypothetical protein LM73068_50071 [Listeria monocytogenes]
MKKLELLYLLTLKQIQLLEYGLKNLNSKEYNFENKKNITTNNKK